MKIVFFEIQEWEKNIIKSSLKKHNLIFTEEPLSENNLSLAKHADAISIFIYSEITSKILAQLKNLKLITTRSTGFDHINIKECKKRKIKVLNIPTYGENTVAEHTFALILALSRKVYKAQINKLNNNFSIEDLKGFDLKNKTIGIIGAGKIGKHVIRIARGFEMNVLVNDNKKDSFLAEELNFEYTSLNELLKKSDIVTLHIPYNKQTYHIINAKTLALMKKGSILINTARGQLVDTSALINSLNKNHVSAAGLDVIEGEELIKEEKELLNKKQKNQKTIKQIAENYELLSRHDVIFTPHIAFYSQEALERIIQKTIENIKCFNSKNLDKETIIC